MAFYGGLKQSQIVVSQVYYPSSSCYAVKKTLLTGVYMYLHAFNGSGTPGTIFKDFFGASWNMGAIPHVLLGLVGKKTTQIKCHA